MTKKIAGIALGIGLLAAGLLFATGSVRAIGNPSFTGVAINTPTWDVVTDNAGTWRVTYQTTLSGPSGNNIQEGVGSVALAAGNVYFDGLGLACSRTGNHFTGWKGPYTAAYPTGSQGLYCAFTGGTDNATGGWGAGWYAHVCRAGETSPAGNGYCTTP